MNDVMRADTARARWERLFSTPKAVLAMLHLGGDDAAGRLRRVREEARILADGGVDAVIVENYFGDADDVRRALEALSTEAELGGTVVGLNVLRDHRLAFALAAEFPVGFVQIDSVAGHLASDADLEYAAELGELRAASPALVFGGVRFKYQPVESGRPEQEDLLIGAGRSDAIVVTGDGTGIETDLSKIRRFRDVLPKEFPLIVGAGVTDGNAADQFRHADGAIVGSFFKDSYRDTGVVDAEHVARFMTAVAAVRAAL